MLTNQLTQFYLQVVSKNKQKQLLGAKLRQFL